jgi:hypothetical protein
MMSYDEYSTWAVLRTRTGLPVLRQINFLRTSKLFSFYLELHENKFKNLIQTSKFKFFISRTACNIEKDVWQELYLYLFALKDLILFGFLIFWLWVYLMTEILGRVARTKCYRSTFLLHNRFLEIPSSGVIDNTLCDKFDYTVLHGLTNVRD